MANYYITGVQKDNGVITHVMLHSVNESNQLQKGSKVSEQYAISLREAGHFIKTLKWDHETAWWKGGATVNVVQEGSRKYLRTSRDATVTDNLDNLIRLNEIV